MWKPTSTYSYPSESEIYHHGIQGMHWGKRNGPPYPLDRQTHNSVTKQAGKKSKVGGGSTSSMNKHGGEIILQSKKEQENNVNKQGVINDNTSKRDQRNIAKEITKAAKKDDEEKIKEIVSKALTDDEKKELNKRRKDFANAPDFYDSKECIEATAKAYEDTYKWFKKNDPDYLKAIIKKNNGDKDTLDQFHDFRKTFEYYEDEAWITAKDAFDKKLKASGKVSEEEAWDNLTAYKKELSDKLVGKYGKKKAGYKHYTQSRSRQTINDRIYMSLDKIQN